MPRTRLRARSRHRRGRCGRWRRSAGGRRRVAATRSIAYGCAARLYCQS